MERSVYRFQWLLCLSVLSAHGSIEIGFAYPDYPPELEFNNHGDSDLNCEIEEAIPLIWVDDFVVEIGAEAFTGKGDTSPWADGVSDRGEPLEWDASITTSGERAGFGADSELDPLFIKKGGFLNSAPTSSSKDASVEVEATAFSRRILFWSLGLLALVSGLLGVALDDPYKKRK